MQSRLEEDQEDMNELMKKHKAAVAQVTEPLRPGAGTADASSPLPQVGPALRSRGLPRCPGVGGAPYVPWGQGSGL